VLAFSLSARSTRHGPVCEGVRSQAHGHRRTGKSWDLPPGVSRDCFTRDGGMRLRDSRARPWPPAWPRQGAPKPPKPIRVKSRRMSEISRNRQLPKPLGLNPLFSVRYATKRPDFWQKDDSATCSPPKLCRCCLSKASKPIGLRGSGMCKLVRKHHRPNPLRLFPIFSRGYVRKRACF